MHCDGILGGEMAGFTPLHTSYKNTNKPPDSYFDDTYYLQPKLSRTSHYSLTHISAPRRNLVGAKKNSTPSPENIFLHKAKKKKKINGPMNEETSLEIL